MKEILKIHFTLYPEGCEVREDELEIDRIVFLSSPKDWVSEEKFEMEFIGDKVEDYREDSYMWNFNNKSSLDPNFNDEVEKIYYKYIVENSFVTIDIQTVWLGFEDRSSSHDPYWSAIDWWKESTSYQETFEGLTEWIIDNFKPVIDKNVSSELPKNVTRVKELKPPFEYVALVDANCNVATSVDWESGVSDVDYVEIILNKIIEL